MSFSLYDDPCPAGGIYSVTSHGVMPGLRGPVFSVTLHCQPDWICHLGDTYQGACVCEGVPSEGEPPQGVASPGPLPKSKGN